MKNLIGVLLGASIVLMFLLGALYGAYVMIHDLVAGGQNFTHGFTVFSLSVLVILVCILTYATTQTLNNTKTLAEIMAQQLTREVEREIKKASQPNNLHENPLMQLLKGGGLFPIGEDGRFPGEGTIKVDRINNDGTLTPLGEKTFKTHEEFIKYRSELFNKAMGAGEKKLEDMTIEELQAEEKKAVEDQNFELASAIVSLIEEKKKK